MGVGKTIDRNSGDMLPADNTVTHVPVSHLNGTPSTVSSVSGTASTMDTVQLTQLLSRYPPSQPTVIEKGVLKFVITDSPSDLNIENHIKELIKYNVTHVCRASEPSYSALPLIRSGIQVHELLFQDGDPPPENVLQKWLLIVEKCFIKNPSLVIKRKFKLSTSDKEVALESGIPEAAYNLKPNDRISVHCVAGLGRAPVLVAVALVEFGGMDPFEAVAFIRKHRRGAINKKQLKWLEQYEPRYATTGCSVGCSLM